MIYRPILSRPCKPFLRTDPQLFPHQRKLLLATPNYGYEKRQRELAKRKKKEEKLKSKTERKHLEPGDPAETADQASTDNEPQAGDQPAQPGALPA